MRVLVSEEYVGLLWRATFRRFPKSLAKLLKVTRTFPNIIEDFIYPLEVNHRTELVKLSFRMSVLCQSQKNCM